MYNVLRLAEILPFKSGPKAKTENKAFSGGPISGEDFHRALEDIRDSVLSRRANPGYKNQPKKGLDKHPQKDDDKVQSEDEAIDHNRLPLGIPWINGLTVQDIAGNTSIDCDYSSGEMWVSSPHHGHISPENQPMDLGPRIYGTKDQLDELFHGTEHPLDEENLEIHEGYDYRHLEDETDSYLEEFMVKVESEVDSSDSKEFYIENPNPQDQIHNTKGVPKHGALFQGPEGSGKPVLKDHIRIDDRTVEASDKEEEGIIPLKPRIEDSIKKSDPLGQELDKPIMPKEELQSQGEPPNRDESQETEGLDSRDPRFLVGDTKELHMDFSKVLNKEDSLERVRIIEELAHKTITAIDGNESEIEVQIKPEHLGKLILRVALEDGNLTGKIYASNDRIKDFLNMNLEDLKSNLMDEGFIFASLDVDVGGQSSRDNFNHLAQIRPRVDKLHTGKGDMAQGITGVAPRKSVDSGINSNQIDYLV